MLKFFETRIAQGPYYILVVVATEPVAEKYITGDYFTLITEVRTGGVECRPGVCTFTIPSMQVPIQVDEARIMATVTEMAQIALDLWAADVVPDDRRQPVELREVDQSALIQLRLRVGADRALREMEQVTRSTELTRLAQELRRTPKITVDD